MIDNELNTPKDIPLGTILIDHYANMMAFFKVIKTTPKSVVLQEMEFDTGASDTGYPYVRIWPTAERSDKAPKRKIVSFLEKGGFAVPGVYGQWGGMSIYNPDRTYEVYWD